MNRSGKSASRFLLSRPRFPLQNQIIWRNPSQVRHAILTRNLSPFAFHDRTRSFPVDETPSIAVFPKSELSHLLRVATSTRKSRDRSQGKTVENRWSHNAAGFPIKDISCHGGNEEKRLRALAPVPRPVRNARAEGSKRRKERESREISHFSPASRGPRGLVESGWRLAPNSSEARRGSRLPARARVGKVRREEEDESRMANTWRKNRSDVPAISSPWSRDRRTHRVRAREQKSEIILLFFLSLSLSPFPCFCGRFQIFAHRRTHLGVPRARYRGRFAATDKRDRVARRCSDTLDGPDERRDVRSTLSPCTY